MAKTARFSLLFMIVLVGCATKRPSLPSDHTTLGDISGLENTRFWGDEFLPGMETLSGRMRQQILDTDLNELNKPQYALALSGGGQNGAFGAGLLNGWSEHGDRPQFRIVTGISTGAIIAPFAFMGEAYDAPLKEMYTTLSTKDIIRLRPLIGLLGGKALSDSSPLMASLTRFIDEQMINAIGVEYNKGRRLFISTTYLDAKRPVIWDVTAIAASEYADKVNLFRRIVLASASIPGVFPPVLFDVTKDKTSYNEMHVDGGVANQIFISPVSFSLREAMDRVGLTGPATIYLIRNSTVHPAWELIKSSTVSISTASINGVIRNQGNTDQHAIHLQAELDGIQCFSAQIPASFHAESKEIFDAKYMEQLFGFTYDLACQGYPWE